MINLNSEWDISLASPPDRENLVAEILYNHIQVAEINTESDKLCIQIYKNPKNEWWEFDYEEFLQALEYAKLRLTN